MTDSIRKYGLSARLRRAIAAFHAPPKEEPRPVDLLFTGKVFTQQVGSKFGCWREAHEIWQRGIEAGKASAIEAITAWPYGVSGKDGEHDDEPRDTER